MENRGENRGTNRLEGLLQQGFQSSIRKGEGSERVRFWRGFPSQNLQAYLLKGACVDALGAEADEGRGSLR